MKKFNVPCVYFNQGNCRNGDNCPFLHVKVDCDPSLLYVGSFIPPTKEEEEKEEEEMFKRGYLKVGFDYTDTDSSEILEEKSEPKVTPTKLNDDDFPDLLGATAVKQKQQTTKQFTMAQKAAIGSLVSKYKWIPVDVVREEFLKCGKNKQKTDEMLSHVAEGYEKRHREEEERNRQALLQHKQQIAAESGEKVLTPEQRALIEEAEMYCRQVVHNPETQSNLATEEISRIYLEARKEANEHREIRDKLLTLSQQSSLTGKGNTASNNMSLEGQYHDAKMKQLNQQASKEIIAAINKANSVEDENYIFREIDVHGLHIEDVERLLDDLRTTDDDNERVRVYAFFTGSGRHSSGNPKLFPFIDEYCHKYGVVCMPVKLRGACCAMKVAFPKYYNESGN